MKQIKILLSGLLLSIWLVMPAYADDHDGLDVSMQLLTSPAASPDAATKIIVLPDAASDNGRANSEFGLATANAAKSKKGREFGQAKANAARMKNKLKKVKKK
jgi:hypothetical protein